MSNVSGIISPTSIDLAGDVRKVLGESSYNLTELWLSKKVNKWSRNKPWASQAYHHTYIGHRYTETELKAGLFGLIPPGGSDIGADVIDNNPAWNALAWGHSRLTTWGYSLGDFLGYWQYAPEPITPTVRASATYYDNSPVVVTATLQKDTTGGITVGDLMPDHYLCILMRPIDGTADTWAIKTSPITLAQMLTSSVGELAATAGELNAIYRPAGSATRATRFRWWVCAASTKFEVLTERTTQQLSDVGACRFYALPTDNLSLQGVTEYHYVDVRAQYTRMEIYGLNNTTTWDGNLEHKVGDTIQFGVQLYDHLYGLNVGFYIENIGSSNITYTADEIRYSYLAVNNNFAGAAPVIQPAAIVRVASPTSSASMGITDVTLAPGGKAYFVVQSSDIMRSPKTHTQTQTGQNIGQVTVTAGFGSVFRASGSFNAYN